MSFNKKEVEHLSALQTWTVTSVVDEAIAIEEILSNYITKSAFTISGDKFVDAEMFHNLKKIKHDATVGYDLLLAFVNGCIETRTKWCVSYKVRDVDHAYLQMAEVLVKNLKIEFAIKNIDIGTWKTHLYENEELFNLLRRITSVIKDALLPTNEWGIIFAQIDHGILKLVDYGDYRIHQWELECGVEFRKKHNLAPARGIIR